MLHIQKCFVLDRRAIFFPPTGFGWVPRKIIVEVYLCPRHLYPLEVHRLHFANVAAIHFLKKVFSVGIVATTTRLYRPSPHQLLYPLMQYHQHLSLRLRLQRSRYLYQNSAVL
jgi:hypothetical protein